MGGPAGFGEPNEGEEPIFPVLIRGNGEEPELERLAHPAQERCRTLGSSEACGGDDEGSELVGGGGWPSCHRGWWWEERLQRSGAARGAAVSLSWKFLQSNLPPISKITLLGLG